MAVGIAFEVRCGSVTMPGEGLPVALCRVTGMAFPKMKIIVDTTLVALALGSSFLFFGEWNWSNRARSGVLWDRAQYLPCSMWDMS